MFQKKKALLFLLVTNLLLGMILNASQILPKEISNIIVENVQADKQWWYCRQKYNIDAAIVSMSLSPDGTYLAIGLMDNKARIFDAKTKKLLFCSSNETYYAPFTLLISFSNNLTHLAIQNSGRKKVDISDAKTRQRLADFKPLEHIYHMSWSNDSCCLAAAGYHTIQIFERYESATLAQLALKYALLNWLLIEKPDKRMIEESYTYDEGIEKILLDVSKKCGLNYYKECVKPWRLFPLKMQEAIARTMHHRIEKYGK